MSTVNLVSCLVHHGKCLAKQLDKAKHKSKVEPAEDNINGEVEKVITGLIKDLDELNDDEYTTKDCFDRVVRKTISCLEELKKHDDPQYASGYEDLVTRVGKFRLSTNNVGSTHGTLTPTHNNNSENDNEDNNNGVPDTHINFKESFESLNSQQKSLFQLFAMLPRGTNIKKNDLFLWCCGSHPLSQPHIDPMKDDGEETQYEKDIRKLVEMKMMEPVVANVQSVRKNNKREGLKYKMPPVIWSKFHDSQHNKEFADFRIEKINSFSISRFNRAVVNTNACNLTTTRINMLAKNKCWMLQLGNWNHDLTKYIVVEDVDSLIKVLKMGGFFLSLEGVSGLVTLPSFEGEYLVVLNLKGCHNLESIPQFNPMRTQKLEYLDMSECHLLDHPANVLDGCEVRVVKGFVLPHQDLRPHDDSFISNPSQFRHLWKLTLRTRRLNFPTNSDLETLCDLKSLTHLKITWVGACSDGGNQQVQFDVAFKFPPKLKKFEMEAASNDTSTKILDLIAQNKKTTPIRRLKKLYIKGGNLSKLNPEVDCKILRLHYLPKMEFDCFDMKRSFPELHRLEMSTDVMYSMLRRSFQKATGTDDQNSGWEPSLKPPPTPPSAS